MRILIWTFKYSASSGVGGRRWRKLGAFLARKGHEVTYVKPVESKEFNAGELGSGCEVVIAAGVLSKHYLNATMRSSLLRRFGVKCFRLFDWLSGRVDHGERWAQFSFPVVKKLIREKKIEVVVASGHPCSLNYWAAVLKAECPDILLVQDFRDTWNDEINYSLQGARNSSNIKLKSLLYEAIAIESADIVLNVSLGQSLRMVALHQSHSKKFHVLENGFDPEDYRVGPTADRSRSNFSIVHAGGIRWQSIIGLNNLVEAVAELENELKKHDVMFDWYGPRPKMSVSEGVWGAAGKFFRFHGTVDQEELAKAVMNASFGMIIFDKSTGLGTKIFDYIGTSTPFFAICPQGELQKFCDEHGMPVSSYEKDDISEMLKSIFTSDKPHTLYASNFKQYSLPHLADKLLDVIS